MIKKCCLKKIYELQTANEYFEFVKKLQRFTSFPQTYMDNSGIYIVLKLSNNIKRKMKLGITYIKEQNGFNLSCYKVDPTNKIILANTTSGGNYVALDHESVISGMVTLLDSYFSTPSAQGLHIFPLQLDIARAILKNPNYNPDVLYKGQNTATVKSTSLNPTKANITININTSTSIGVGSGLGELYYTIENNPTPAIPVTDTDNIFTLQSPQNTFSSFNVNPLPLNSYNVFQIAFVGDQRNSWNITLQNNKTVMDFPFLVLSALR